MYCTGCPVNTLLTCSESDNRIVELESDKSDNRIKITTSVLHGGLSINGLRGGLSINGLRGGLSISEYVAGYV